jgi:hypothetical protein
MDKFRVLVVDDGLAELTAATDWLHRGVDLLPAPPDVITAGSAAEAAAAIKHSVRSGAVIGAAIVDPGLGPRQPSGLGVIQLLAQTGVPAAVWTDWGEGRRLMFVYAAFTWYQPVGLIPKGRVTQGAGGDRAARDFARNIVRIHRREPLTPDLAAYFRPTLGREWPFEQILSTPADLRNWRAFCAYSQTAAVAAHVGLRPRVIDKWLTEKYEPVWKIIDHASKYMEINDIDIAQPPDYLQEHVKEEKKVYVDRKAALHQFARSQSWFFNDPVVTARFSAA